MWLIKVLQSKEKKNIRKHQASNFFTKITKFPPKFRPELIKKILLFFSFKLNGTGRLVNTWALNRSFTVIDIWMKRKKGMATRCNNRDYLPKLNFTLNISIFYFNTFRKSFCSLKYFTHMNLLFYIHQTCHLTLLNNFW